MTQDIFQQWGFPTIDLFATSQNSKCPTFCSRAGLGLGSRGDTFLLRWDAPLLYTFPPTPLLSRVIQKIKTNQCRVILIASKRPRQTWFPYLQQRSECSPHVLPLLLHLLSQDAGQIFHLNLKILPPERMASLLRSSEGYLAKQQMIDYTFDLPPQEQTNQSHHLRSTAIPGLYISAKKYQLFQRDHSEYTLQRSQPFTIKWMGSQALPIQLQNDSYKMSGNSIPNSESQCLHGILI